MAETVTKIKLKELNEKEKNIEKEDNSFAYLVELTHPNSAYHSWDLFLFRGRNKKHISLNSLRYLFYDLNKVDYVYHGKREFSIYQDSGSGCPKEILEYQGKLIHRIDNWFDFFTCKKIPLYHEIKNLTLHNKEFYGTIEDHTVAIIGGKKNLQWAGVDFSREEGIVKLRPNFKIDHFVAKREESSNTLCSHNGKLYDASTILTKTDSGYYKKKVEINETLSNKIIKTLEARTRPKLISHKGRLYVLTLDEKYDKTDVRDVFSGEIINNVHGGVFCSYNGKLLVNKNRKEVIDLISGETFFKIGPRKNGHGRLCEPSIQNIIPINFKLEEIVHLDNLKNNIEKGFEIFNENYKDKFLIKEILP